MNELNLLKLARKFRTPTAIGALVLLILYVILRVVLSLDIFSPLGEENTYQIVNRISTGLLVLGFFGMLLAAVAYIYVTQRKVRLSNDGKDTEDDEASKPLPTFEIGECTDEPPRQMKCTGEIIRGVPAAKRVVEEIEKSGEKRFDVYVTGLERIRSYLAEMKVVQGEEIEHRHELERAEEDWEKHRSIFQSGVEYILWHSVFRRTANIFDSKSAAETICGLSKHCFENVVHDPEAWWLWHSNDWKTRLNFLVPKEIRGSMLQDLRKYKAYQIGYFDPDVRHLHVLPPLLRFISEQKIKGASLVKLDEYIDVSKWSWSVANPHKYGIVKFE